MDKQYVRMLTTAVAAVVLAVSACGDSGNGGNRGGGGGNESAQPSDNGGGGGNGSAGPDCLTAEQVQAEVDKIAGGFESSQDEVEAKQQAIQQVRARECP